MEITMIFGITWINDNGQRQRILPQRSQRTATANGVIFVTATTTATADGEITEDGNDNGEPGLANMRRVGDMTEIRRK
jgi:hypothetical protein